VAAAPPADGPFPAPADPGFPTDEDHDPPADDLPFGRATNDLYEDLDHVGGRHKAVTALIAVVVLLVVLGGAYLGGSWYADRTYFVGTDGDEVVVFRGKPGGFLIFDPSVSDRTDLTLQDLEPDVADGVQAQQEFGSRANALSFVRNGVARDEPEPTTTTTTEPRSTTTTTSTTEVGSTTTAGQAENVPPTTAGP
jgi:protein phosphatase